MVLTLLATGASSLGQPVVRNGLLAMVNESVITYQDVARLQRSQLEALLSTYRFQPEVLEQKRAQVLTEGLEQMIERQLVLDDFKNQGGAIPEDAIDEEIKDRIRRIFGTRARLTRTLQAEGKTYESYRQELRDDIIYNYMRQLNITKALIISPSKIEEYYQTNVAQYSVGEQIKLRMIVLGRSRVSPVDDTRRLAQEILAKLQAGAPFAEMAALYSEGTQAREGGDWGWVERTRLNRGLADIAFGLKLDQLSSVVSLAREPSDDYWICQHDADGRIHTARKYTRQDVFVEEKKPATPLDLPALPPPREFYVMGVEDHRMAHTKPLQDVRDQIENDLLIQERERLRKRWIDRLKAKSFVRIFQ